MPKKVVKYLCSQCGFTYDNMNDAARCEAGHKDTIEAHKLFMEENLDTLHIECRIAEVFNDAICDYCDGEFCSSCPVQANDVIEVFKKYPGSKFQQDIIDFAERLKKEVKDV